MDFKQIEAFVNVVKYHNFSKAADASFLTQPTISAHISSLEKELGMQLIERGGKEAVPTRQGQLFFKYAVAMIGTREKAVYSLKNYNESIEGVIEIFASNVPYQYILPNLMVSFKKKYHNVKFYVEQEDSGQVNDSIREQKAEIGFTGSRTENDLSYVKLEEDNAVLITPKNEKYSKLHGRPIKMADFMEEEFVWRELGSGSRKAFERAMTDMGISMKKMNVIARMSNLTGVKKTVSAGLGISVISGLSAERDTEKADYLVFDIEDFKFERNFYMTYHKQTTLSPTAEMFKKHVMEEYNIK